jgi:peptidoglycan/LPS O-acetylase OafA/YrhL
MLFGSLRTTLALMVMVHHLFYPDVLGPYAVFGFYILSGYLMTLIMHESYGFHKTGRIHFAINRFLRLFPMYWIAAIFTLLMIYIVGGEAVQHYHRSMFIPSNMKSIIENVLMIFPGWRPDEVNPRLVPTTWALTVEMFFYLIICIGASKNIFRVKVWFLASLAYVALSFYLGGSTADRYFPIPAASLPFSIGALLYFCSKIEGIRLGFIRSRLSTNILFAAMLINVLLWVLVKHALKLGEIAEIGFYLNLVICSALIFSVIMGGKIAFIGKRADKFIGDLSYPIYLMQWQVGLLVSFLLFGFPLHDYSISGLWSLWVSIVVVIMLSVACVFLIDRPVQAVRERIKANNALNPAGGSLRTTLSG